MLPGTDRPVCGTLREPALTESLRLWAVGALIGAKHALNGQTVPYVAASRDISKHSLRSTTVTVAADHLQILSTKFEGERKKFLQHETSNAGALQRRRYLALDRHNHLRMPLCVILEYQFFLASNLTTPDHR